MVLSRTQGSFLLLILSFSLFFGCSQPPEETSTTKISSPPVIKKEDIKNIPKKEEITPEEKSIFKLVSYKEGGSSEMEKITNKEITIESDTVSIFGFTNPNTKVFLGSKSWTSSGDKGEFKIKVTKLNPGENNLKIGINYKGKNKEMTVVKVIREGCYFQSGKRCYNKMKLNYKINSFLEAEGFCEKDSLEMVSLNVLMEDHEVILGNMYDNGRMFEGTGLLLATRKKGKEIKNGWVEEVYIRNYKQEHSTLTAEELNMTYYPQNFLMDPISDMGYFNESLIWLSDGAISDNTKYYDRKLSGYDVLCYRNL